LPVAAGQQLSLGPKPVCQVLAGLPAFLFPDLPGQIGDRLMANGRIILSCRFHADVVSVVIVSLCLVSPLKLAGS